MRAKLIGGTAVVLVAAGVFLIFADRQPAYQPAVDPGAYLHLAFEGNLDNLGKAQATGEARDGEAVFAQGPTGRSLHAQGDGSFLHVDTPDLRDLSGAIEISFDFKPEDWTNPYEKGSAVKTVAAVTGKSGDRLRHAVFNISNGSRPSLTVSVETATGAKHKLNSEPGAITTGWHSVRLHIDQSEERTRLYLDDDLIAEADIVPSVVTDGIDRVRIGTWHKQNQAYRGLVDNMMVREVTD